MKRTCDCFKQPHNFHYTAKKNDRRHYAKKDAMAKARTNDESNEQQQQRQQRNITQTKISNVLKYVYRNEVPCSQVGSQTREREIRKRDLRSYLSTRNWGKAKAKVTRNGNHIWNWERADWQCKRGRQEAMHHSLYINAPTFFGGNYFAVIVQSMASTCVFDHSALFLCALCVNYVLWSTGELMCVDAMRTTFTT